MIRRVGLLLLAAFLAPADAAAQRAVAAVRPDTIRVGDPAVFAVRVLVPAGQQAAFPDTLDIAGDLENTGLRRIVEDTAADGTRGVTAFYPVTAWRPGDHAFPAMAVRLLTPDGAETAVQTPGTALHVASVLPADTAGIEPRPPKDVLGGERRWGLSALLLALLALAALAAWLAWRRRRRRTGIDVAPGAPPREVALATLERARREGHVEAGEFKAFYSLIAEALRHYQAALEPAWGADLTTRELIGRMRADERVPDAAAIEDVLQRADMVKFARRDASADDAWRDWNVARDWITAFDWPPPRPEVAEAEPALQEVA